MSAMPKTHAGSRGTIGGGRSRINRTACDLCALFGGPDLTPVCAPPARPCGAEHAFSKNATRNRRRLCTWIPTRKPPLLPPRAQRYC